MPESAPDDVRHAPAAQEAAQAPAEPQGGPSPLPAPSRPVEGVDGAPDGEPVGAPGDRVAALSREAAQRRRQLREAEERVRQIEAERDALRAQLDARDRQEIERIATTAESWGTRLRDPADLWLAEPDLTAFRDEEGALDPARVRAVVGRIAQERPHWVETAPGVPFDGGVGLPTPAPGPSIGRALKDARRRG